MIHEKQPRLIGSVIAALRTERDYTIDVLAERSGISKAMLTQIEAENVNPTVATIWKIAHALEIDLDQLMVEGHGPVRHFHLSKHDTIPVLDTDEEGLHIRVLTPLSMAEELEMYLLTFAPNGVLRSQPHVTGSEEFLTVISGRVRVRAGDRSGELHSGDFIRYQCDVPHEIENVGGENAVVHMVVRFRPNSKVQPAGHHVVTP